MSLAADGAGASQQQQQQRCASCFTKTIDISQWMQCCFLDIIGTAGFGLEFNALDGSQSSIFQVRSCACVCTGWVGQGAAGGYHHLCAVVCVTVCKEVRERESVCLKERKCAHGYMFDFLVHLVLVMGPSACVERGRACKKAGRQGIGEWEYRGGCSLHRHA